MEKKKDNDVSKRIYFDHSSTTPVDKDVLTSMLPYFSDDFGNANSLHEYGRDAALAVDSARNKIAALLEVKPSEIYFTSGGTESNNWALKGTPIAGKRNRVIISSVEHPSVLSSAKQLKNMGAEIVLLPVTKDGFVSTESLNAEIDGRTSLVSIMLANNEVGTVQPIKELTAIACEAGAYFHTDAVQAVGSIPVLPKDLGVDMLSLSAHKFYGPKGIGVLYIKSGIKLEKLHSGGHQERSARGGTTNVPAVVGLSAALNKAITGQKENGKRIAELRDYFIAQALKYIPYTALNGSTENRLPQNANLTFDFIEGESLLLCLDAAGIACSSGSACSSESLEPSHVLLAMGIPAEKAHGSLRFSFGVRNTKEEVDYTIKQLIKIVAKLREMSPLWQEFQKESTNV